jgi:hypothetical protein
MELVSAFVADTEMYGALQKFILHVSVSAQQKIFQARVKIVTYVAITAVNMNILIFWNVTPCILVDRYEYFRKLYYRLHIPGSRASYHDSGSRKFLRNAGNDLLHHIASHPKSQ